MAVAAIPYIIAAAAAVGAGAAIHSGQVQSNYNEYLSDQAQADAAAKKAAAGIEADRIRASGEQQRKQAIAALAGSGVDVDSGTALKISRTITGNAANDAFMTITGGDNTAARLSQQSQAYGIQAGQATSASYVNATSSLLQGASSTGNWYQKTGST